MKKLLAVIGFAMMISIAMAADYQEGTQYNSITPPPPPGSGNEIVVEEFFMYTCPHCKDLEPKMNNWLEKKPEGVKFSRVPAMFGGAANLHAKAYYALEIIGEGERLHEPLFHAIHDEHKRLNSQKALEGFLEENKVDMDKYRAAFSSFTVQTKANRAAALMRRYGIRSVPAMVVDGRYRVKNSAEVVEVTDYLVKQVGESRNPAAPAK